MGVLVGLGTAAASTPLVLVALRKKLGILRMPVYGGLLSAFASHGRALGRAATGLGALSVLLALVQVFGYPERAAYGPAGAEFPDRCPKGIPGCTRVARAESRKTGGLEPLVLGRPVDEVAARVQAWVASEPRSRIVARSVGAREAVLHSK